MINKFLKQLKNAPVIYVKPSDIANQHSLNKHEFKLNGDWDLSDKTIYKGVIFKSFAQRLKGSAWETTTLYKRKKRLGKRWLRKLPIWDKMLYEIVSEGYTQQPNKDPIDEYISILIGRDGKMFIYNGIHRLICCLLSKREDKIPIKVLFRHTDWAAFKRSCEHYAVRRGSLYCQLPHPDLENIPYYWTNNRAELVAFHSKFPKGTVLDAGSHWGTTSSVLASKGFKVTAVEKSLGHFRKLRHVSRFPNAAFTPIHDDVLTMSGKFNTLVLLNLAHHFTTNASTYGRFIDFLNDVKTDEIFYQSHGPESKWAPYMSPEETLRSIFESTEMNSVTELGEFNDRKLWHLTKGG